MSYCRFGPNSDVYAYPHCGGGYVCRGCSRDEAETQKRFRTRIELFAHLLQHLESGDRVPQSAFDRLESEIAA